MPSAALRHWRGERLQRIDQIDVQCGATLALAVPNPRLADENLRGYIVLLSAHFQGHCRDLFSECSQIVASKVRPALQVLIQSQFTAHRALDHNNPNHDTIKKDFNRFGFKLDLTAADPAKDSRQNNLPDCYRVWGWIS